METQYPFNALARKDPRWYCGNHILADWQTSVGAIEIERDIVAVFGECGGSFIRIAAMVAIRSSRTMSSDLTGTGLNMPRPTGNKGTGAPFPQSAFDSSPVAVHFGRSV